MNNAAMSTFNGVITKVFSRDKDTGFSILQVKGADDESQRLIESKGRKSINVLGTYFNPVENALITCEGCFDESPKWGFQFKASNIFITSLTKKSHAEDSLRSRIFNSISRSKKEELISKYGASVLLHINTDRYIHDGLLNKSQLHSLRGDLYRFIRVSETFNYLRGLGFRIDAIDSILESFGNAGKEIIANDPYKLLAVSGVGFGNIDTAAVSMGMEMTSMKRIKHGFGYIIKNHMEGGHTGFYLDDMVKRISYVMDLPNDIVKELLINYVKSGQYMITSKNDRLLLIDYSTHMLEQDCAREIKRIMRAKADIDVGPYELDTGYLKEGQVKAINNSLNNKISIITGGPGVGKTTVVKTIIETLEKNNKKDVILLAAPTGQASERMFDATGKNACTIHTLLDYHPDFGFRKNADNKLNCTTLVIDELSMVDIILFLALLAAIPDNCRVIFVGDVDQLPSIGPGSILQDLISSRRIAVSRLTEVTRVDSDSTIPKNAHLINSGKMPDLSNTSKDFHWIPAKSDHEILSKLCAVVSAIPGTYNVSFNDLQILTPQKGTLVGVDSINKEIRKIINPNYDPSSPSFSSFGSEFRRADRVIVTKNNKKLRVNNGEIGLISEINHGTRTAKVSFSKNSKELPFIAFADVKHAYAITGHKSQGSEYKFVVIPISESHSGMLNIQLLYTMVTRAKVQVFLVGSEVALENALKNKYKERRITMLDIAIEKEFSNSIANNRAEPSFLEGGNP